MKRLKQGLVGLIVLGSVFIGASLAGACGGFFCQNSPVSQAAERIVFSVNNDGTVTSLIEISYVGTAEDFSWILPIPEAIAADDLEVPTGGDLVFDQLHDLTDVVFLAPRGDCVSLRLSSADEATFAPVSSDGGVEVFASGEVGPFGFDVIGSSNQDALINWLRDNQYQVTPDMEPLIDLYVQEEFAFVAMRLLDGQDVNAIQPIEITYPGTKAMIPLRLTAVAAFDDMPIYVWIFGDHPAVPENYGHMEINTEELTFFGSSNNTNYVSLVQGRANALGGQAFITEMASPTTDITFSHTYLVGKAAEHRYLTRLLTYISPHEMSVDPVFDFDPDAADVSRVRDARDMKGLRDCDRDSSVFLTLGSNAADPVGSDGLISATPATVPLTNKFGFLPALLLLAGGGGAFLVWRRNSKYGL